MFIKLNGAQLLPLRWKTVVSTKSQPDDVHVIRDWDNAPLPTGYDIETLFTKMEEGLKKHNPSMTIKSVVAVLSTKKREKKKIADDRTRFFKQDTRCTIIKVPSRKRTCDGCGHTFPNVSDLTEQQRADRFKGQDEYSRVTDPGNDNSEFQSSTSLLCSPNKDFESSMNFMTRRGYKVPSHSRFFKWVLEVDEIDPRRKP
ncbi:hypothetical protein HID58_096207 [Brassica napus]|uniref:Uncharacterized protein n=1 Tax=Brassica napus TaxID=3708 RepID=A0ABQ7X159_BRANA|nr:hypothetical protein HID58_096207 [Brassica napus]